MINIDNLPDLSKFNDKTKNLNLLAEECSEVIHRICKIHRFGLYDSRSLFLPDNKELLGQEVGDLILTLLIVLKDGTIEEDGMETAVFKKYRKLLEWY